MLDAQLIERILWALTAGMIQIGRPLSQSNYAEVEATGMRRQLFENLFEIPVWLGRGLISSQPDG
jgi:hypothetical protein